MANQAPRPPGTRIVNGKLHMNGNRDRGQCPITSCDFGKSSPKARGQVIDHLRGDHKIGLPVCGMAYKKVPGGPRYQPGKGTNAWNADCLKVFLEWANENDVLHDGGHLLFRPALANGSRKASAATAIPSIPAGNGPTAESMENATGDATEEQDGEDGEEEDELLDEDDYDYGANVNDTLSEVTSQLRADSRSLSLSLADLGKVLDNGLHHQLIDYLVNTEADHLRNDSGYRCFLLVTIIDFVHHSAYRAYELDLHLLAETRRFQQWLNQLTGAQQGRHPHLQYIKWAGTERAENGFFDVMYGLHMQALAVNKPKLLPNLDLKAIVSELGGEMEAYHATNTEHDMDELRLDNPVLLSTAIKKALKAWLRDYLDGFNQTFFQHLDWEIDYEEKRKEEESRVKEPWEIDLEDG